MPSYLDSHCSSSNQVPSQQKNTMWKNQDLVLILPLSLNIVCVAHSAAQYDVECTQTDVAEHVNALLLIGIFLHLVLKQNKFALLHQLCRRWNIAEQTVLFTGPDQFFSLFWNNLTGPDQFFSLFWNNLTGLYQFFSLFWMSCHQKKLDNTRHAKQSLDQQLEHCGTICTPAVCPGLTYVPFVHKMCALTFKTWLSTRVHWWISELIQPEIAFTISDSSFLNLKS